MDRIKLLLNKLNESEYKDGALHCLETIIGFAQNIHDKIGKNMIVDEELYNKIDNVYGILAEISDEADTVKGE